MQTDSAKDFKIKEKEVLPQPASANEKKQKIKQSNIAVQLLISLIAGVSAALLGGVVWGLLTILSGKIFMLIAIGIGAICGLSVAKFADGKDNIGFQIIAVLSSLLGIATGKYISFFYYLKKITYKNYSIFDSSITEIFSEKLIRIFVENITSMLGVFDIFCIIAAVFFALVIAGQTES